MARLRSPSYPSYPLEDAIENARTIFEKDRSAPIDREVVASHLGYKSLNGAADKSLSTMMQYGMLDKVAKGEVAVSQWAIDILFPDNPAQRVAAIRNAASKPKLFTSLGERFPDGPPSEEAFKAYLIRENFNDRAIGPVMNAYTKTCAFLQREGASETSIPSPTDGAIDGEPKDQDENSDTVFGGAQVGDLIQWEIDGNLQMETPMRVRLVDEIDGHQFVAVEDSETGIPMEQVVVQDRGTPPPIDAPTFKLKPRSEEAEQSPLAEGWKEERLIDDGGEEIFIRYKGEPTPERYTYIRDYLDFKLLRMNKS